jgi:hypothetical protein
MAYITPGGSMRALNFIPVILAMAVLGCGISEISISIEPKQVTVKANDQFQFAASVGAAGNKTVLWSATGGSVTDTGLFTAPEATGTCYVVATSQADQSKTAASVVTIIAPVVVTPGTVTVAPGATQLFTAEVAATGDTNVTWSIKEGPSGGTIAADGSYTAPAATGTYRVVATSVADPTLTGIAIVTVATAP